MIDRSECRTVRGDHWPNRRSWLFWNSASAEAQSWPSGFKNRPRHQRCPDIKWLQATGSIRKNLFVPTWAVHICPSPRRFAGPTNAQNNFPLPSSKGARWPALRVDCLPPSGFGSFFLLFLFFRRARPSSLRDPAGNQFCRIVMCGGVLTLVPKSPAQAELAWAAAPTRKRPSRFFRVVVEVPSSQRSELNPRDPYSKHAWYAARPRIGASPSRWTNVQPCRPPSAVPGPTFHGFPAQTCKAERLLTVASDR